MAKLDDLFAHHDDFKPNAPKSEADQCKCPECGKSASFSEWAYHDGMHSGFWCEECNDFHSCFKCPSCSEYFGAAGTYSKLIEVEVADHECCDLIHNGLTTPLG